MPPDDPLLAPAPELPDVLEDPGREIVAWASADWDEASTRLVDRLRAFAAGRRDRVSGAEAFVIAHLCGEKGERRAFAPLCRLVAEDSGIADWLDDAVTETLPGILIRSFDGNVAPLRRAVESARGDPFARASALAALGYLVRSQGAMTDAAMRAFLQQVRREAPPRSESVFWLIWASTAASLGYAGMRAEVEGLRRDGYIPDGDFRGADFAERVALARADASGLAGFAVDCVAPLDDATPAILAMARAQAAQAGRRLQAFIAGRAAARPARPRQPGA